jgi:TolA-binding protein
MQREPSGKEKVLQRLSATIHKLRYILIAVLGALAILVVTWIIVGEVRSNRIESSTVLVEMAEEKFESWIGEEDEETATKLAEEIIDELTRVVDDYPRLYAGQRALHLLGSFYFRSANWPLSADSFLKLADKFPDSYLAPISRINAAVAMEESGDYAKAIQTYVQVLDLYQDISPEIARVLFSLGRLNETQGTKEAALEYYNRIVDEHPSSGWTNLAQDRIIYLNLD